MANQSIDSNTGKKKVNDGEKSKADKNKKSQSSTQDESKTKQDKDNKKLKGKDSGKEDRESTSDVDNEFNENINNGNKLTAYLDLFNRSRSEIFTQDSKGKFVVSKKLRDQWSKMQKRAKGFAIAGKALEKLGRGLEQSISGGYETGQGLMHSVSHYK